MKNALITFLKKPTTKAGIITAIMFQIIFSLIWMTGYDGAMSADRMKNLKVGIVSLDTQMGSAVAENLQESLPVQTLLIADEATAKTQLNERKLQMVITIPSDFSELVMNPDKIARLHYDINESNAATVKSIMGTIVGNVTSSVNKQAIALGAKNLLGGNDLTEQQVASAADSLSERITSDISYSNPVNGMNNQMLPMMMVLAGYIGAMLLSLNLQQSSMMIGGQLSKWEQFAARGIINIVSSIVVSLVGTSLLVALGGQMEQGFIAVWGFQALFILTFMFVSQLFLMLFGNAGMLLNIMTLSSQLVTSGATLPRELLSDFYHGLGSILPATYAVEGSMNLLYGGPGVGHSSLALLFIMIVTLAAGALAVLLRKVPEREQ
ncbi:YhgE/Pip domain-containing protein [Paenibacillus sinopodophylli]|uniref:YhgE/Pip domain-containing protein n=1 Tax=Paenibacillus sinopodophylli TaxID=1837342 RepID=UPI00110CD0F6|nr:ABC transporter permease [Paenibacillus sinopodophylli]